MYNRPFMTGLIPPIAFEICVAAALAASPAAGPAWPSPEAPARKPTPTAFFLLPPRAELPPAQASPAQQPGQPRKPDPAPSEQKPGDAQQPGEARQQQLAPPHRFFDKKNNWLFAGAFMARSLDFASTLNMRARGRDEILLTNDIVDNEPAFALVEIGGVALNVGLAYWLHRKNHHKLERWLSIVHISVTTFGAGRNYMLETRRTLPTPP